MLKKDIYKFISLLVLILTSSILYINHFSLAVNLADSQKEKQPLKNLRTAAQYEYDEEFGTINDTSSIQIELPDLSWNITEIKLNFTNINQHRQLRTIEGNLSEITFKDIYFAKWKDYRRYFGQHINFSEPTRLYGVYLYGFKTFLAAETVEVYFTDFDGGAPGFNTIYPSGPIYPKINITNVMGWYYQDFSTYSLTFNNDDYYFIINGSDIWSGYPSYYFGYNKKNPTYPLLWEWERNYIDGDFAYKGEPFMMKILQKVNKTYFPENIKMKALINDEYHDIINGTKSGEGNLSLTLLNFKPDKIFLDLPIVINDDSIQLIYNVSYYIKLKKPISVMIIGVDGSKNVNDSKTSMGIAPEFFYIVIFLIIFSFIAALTSYQAIKRIRIKKEEFKKNIFNKYKDILNLNYVIVCDKDSGLCIYEKAISDKNIDPTLVSGFLQAISSFGIEITGSEEQSQTIKLEYQKSKILMSEFKNYRIINIFADKPSKVFTEAIIDLSQELDKKYGDFFENFDGELSQFEGIDLLLEKHLQISLNYPLKIVISNNLKLNRSEKSIVNRASDIMKKNNSNHFFVSYLISEKEFNPKRAELILKLINKKVFQPVNLKQIQKDELILDI